MSPHDGPADGEERKVELDVCERSLKPYPTMTPEKCSTIFQKLKKGTLLDEVDDYESDAEDNLADFTKCQPIYDNGEYYQWDRGLL